MSNTHIIGRQRFRIKLNGKEEAQPILARLSALANNRLSAEIDALLTELAPPDQTLRIDRLVIDVGQLAESKLEDEVVERVLTGIRSQLQALLPDTEETETPNLDRLAHFLQRGYWPWSTPTQTMHSPAELMLDLLDKHPEELRTLLVKLTQQSLVRQRLAHQFPQTSLDRVNTEFHRRGWPTVRWDVVPITPPTTVSTVHTPGEIPEEIAQHSLKNTSKKGPDLLKKPARPNQSPEPVAPQNNHPVEESLYVHNAGLVITAAFLPRYFDTLGLLEGQVFNDEEAALRGVLLLEYLASGRTEVAEHELVFNKVLCGLPPTTPVPNAIELTEQEIEVSDQLLNAVLQNWEQMRNATVENLRASFLLREGLLRERDGHWALDVESRGFDVLLSFLPWTISVVELPWMAMRLETVWKTDMS